MRRLCRTDECSLAIGLGIDYAHRLHAAYYLEESAVVSIIPTKREIDLAYDRTVCVSVDGRLVRIAAGAGGDVQSHVGSTRRSAGPWISRDRRSGRLGGNRADSIRGLSPHVPDRHGGVGADLVRRW